MSEKLIERFNKAVEEKNLEIAKDLCINQVIPKILSPSFLDCFKLSPKDFLEIDEIIIFRNASAQGLIDIARIKIIIDILISGNIILAKHNFNMLVLSASKYCNLEILKLLFEYNKNINFWNSHSIKIDDNFQIAMNMSLKYPLKNNNIEVVKFLLEKGIDLNNPDYKGNLPIFYAIEYNNIGLLKLLIESGADLNLKNAKGETMLMLAAISDQLELIKMLVEKGININIQDNEGKTSVIYAIQNNKNEAFEMLIESGADITLKDNTGKTALMFAITLEQLEVIKLLVEKSSNINLQDNEGKTPLMYAIQNKQNEAAKILIENDADINLKDDAGRTTLMYAAISGQSEIIKLLLEKVSDINIQDKEGKTSLIYAIQNKQIEGLKILVEHGSDINLKDNTGKTALMYAAISGQSEIIKLLLEKVSDINIQDKEGKTSLIYAIQNKQIEGLKILVEHGIDINLKDSTGKTTLMYAAISGQWEIIKLLLEKVSDINIQDIEGKTALIYAIQNKQIEGLKILVEHGIDINLKDNTGKTTLMYAAISRQSEIIKLLLEKVSDINIQDKEGKTALTYAIPNKQTEALILLIKNRADKNLKENTDKTTLMHAAKLEQTEVMKILIENGSNINIQDNTGKTLLMYAIENQNIELSKLLLENRINIHLKNAYGRDALIYSSIHGQNEIANLLIANGINTYLKDNEQVNAMSYALEKGYFDIAQAILNNGTELNIIDNNHMNTLMRAINHFHSKNKTILLESIKKIIEYGVDVNHEDISGNTALFYAIEREFIDVIKFLIDSGANVNHANREKESPLLYSVKNPDRYNIDIINLLIDSGADIKAEDKYGNNVVIYIFISHRFRVLSQQSEDLIISLIENGINIKGIYNEGKLESSEHFANGTNLLMFAAACGSLKIVKYLLNNNFEVNETDSDGKTAIDYYLMYLCDTVVNKEIVKKLIDSGAKVNNVLSSLFDYDDCSLNYFGKGRKFDSSVKEILKIIIDNYGCKDKISYELETVLYKCLNYDLYETFLYISDFIKNKEMISHVFKCMFHDNLNRKNFYYYSLIFKKMIDLGADINYIDKTEDNLATPLIEFIENFQPSGDSVFIISDDTPDYFKNYIKMFIENGADFNIPDERGMTPLMHCNIKDFSVFKLISPYININAKDKFGNTALMHAIKDKHIDFAKILISNGADINIVNNNNETSLVIAVKNLCDNEWRNGNCEVIDQIIYKELSVKLNDNAILFSPAGKELMKLHKMHYFEKFLLSAINNANFTLTKRLVKALKEYDKFNIDEYIQVCQNNFQKSNEIYQFIKNI